jgi:hypothetical protein
MSIPQSVWWIRMISLVPRRRWEMARERISSSVTTHVDAGVHAGQDGDLLGRGERQGTAEGGGVGGVVGEELVGDGHGEIFTKPIEKVSFSFSKEKARLLAHDS